MVDKNFYAVGLGITVPLFDGLSTDRQLDKSSSEIMEKEFELAVHKQSLATLESKLDEAIKTAEVRIEHETKERELAVLAYKKAKTRYFAAEGTLADMRDAIRNLSRTSTSLVNAKADLLEASQSKIMWAGNMAQ